MIRAGTLLLVFVAGCGGTLTAATPTCADLQHAIASWQARCEGADLSNVDARTSAYCSAGAPGDHAFDRACIDELATAECNRYPRECIAATAQTCAGARLEGDRCGSGVACAPLLVCKIAPGETDGVCATTTGAPGDICSTATDCVASAFCDYNLRTCEVRRVAGDGCWSGYECSPGLVCLGNPGICTATGKIGDACGECLSGLVCTNGRCARPVSKSSSFPAPSTCR